MKCQVAICCAVGIRRYGPEPFASSSALLIREPSSTSMEDRIPLNSIEFGWPAFEPSSDGHGEACVHVCSCTGNGDSESTSGSNDAGDAVASSIRKFEGALALVSLLRLD